MTRWGMTALLLVTIGALTLAGCSSAKPAVDKVSTDGGSVDKDVSEPVTLTFYRHSTGMTEEEFNQFIGDPVKKKFPNISFNFTQQANGMQPEDLVASGQLPDLMITDQGGLRKFTDLQMVQDLSPLIKQYNMDVSKFDPVTIQIVKGFSAQNQLIGIPFSINFSGFFYNKNVFDKFAVPYPKDGMSWNDVIELGKRIGRVENGVSYKAIYPNPLTSIANDNGLPYIDPKTNQANLQTDDWKLVLETFRSIKTIPENMNVPTPIQLFENDQLAMLSSGVARIGDFDKLYKQGKPVNWDVIQHPKLPKYNSTGLGSMSPAFLMISNTTKNKDAAFKVINYVTQKENQLSMTENGRLSSLKDQTVRDRFGQGLESMKGKNVKGMLALPFAGFVQYTEYDGLVGKAVNAAGDDVAAGKKDINTALRDAEEQANKDIAAAKQK